MHLFPIERLLRRSTRVAAWTLFVLAAAGGADARTFSVSHSPSVPTWQDPVTLAIEGVACAPTLGTTVVSSPAAGGAIDLELSDSCDTAPLRPFRLEVPLGRLTPGSYSIALRDRSAGGVGHTPLEVYDVAPFDLLLPPAPTDATPVLLQIGSYQGCRSLDLLEVQAGVVSVAFYESCFVPVPVRASYAFVPLSLGLLPAGDYELRVGELLPFASSPRPRRMARTRFRVWDADGCVPSDQTLCLHAGRFAVRATWRDFDGATGAAHAAPLTDNEQSGLLWFFGADNSELTVKVLEGCPVNGHWWAFVSSSSTVEYQVEITDTRTGSRRTFGNTLGRQPALDADTEAFVCP